ncbi:RNA polymerase sigma factor [Chondrinema litorale]|uniref:RNA polymerase sigma factor n=1 Tax=Chondrinema litorale TaxID=2994555 RepID=UPI002543D341|nr:RNA polymerase sigma factor [Chondrinema litorale]UZR95769.1 RNA polymerase sigma factor [Chondrinema litorale]
MDKLSDNALMLQVKDNQVDKLALLFERYHKQLFGYFYHLTSNKQVSEDLVQNTFYRILKYRKNFKGDGAFRAWMYSIARNSQADFFRKNKIQNQSDEIENWSDKLPANSDLLEIIYQKEDLETLREALSRLDIEKREILVLSKFQGMKYKEIGELLNCTENVVKVRVYRALQDLKKIFCHLNINKDYDL